MYKQRRHRLQVNNQVFVHSGTWGLFWRWNAMLVRVISLNHPSKHRRMPRPDRRRRDSSLRRALPTGPTTSTTQRLVLLASRPRDSDAGKVILDGYRIPREPKARYRVNVDQIAKHEVKARQCRKWGRSSAWIPVNDVENLNSCCVPSD